MAEFPITSAWCDPAALAALSEQLARERVVQLSGFLAELPELPPAGQLEREERSGFAVRATGPLLLADFWRSPALAEWLVHDDVLAIRRDGQRAHPISGGVGP